MERLTLDQLVVEFGLVPVEELPGEARGDLWPGPLSLRLGQQVIQRLLGDRAQVLRPVTSRQGGGWSEARAPERILGQATLKRFNRHDGTAHACSLSRWRSTDG